jgi:hypothetical protein
MQSPHLDDLERPSLGRVFPLGYALCVPLRVQIVTAEREVFAEDAADMVVAPGSEGVLGILPRHAPLLTTLQPGVIRIKKGSAEEAMAVGGGFLQARLAIRREEARIHVARRHRGPERHRPTPGQTAP